MILPLGKPTLDTKFNRYIQVDFNFMPESRSEIVRQGVRRVENLRSDERAKLRSEIERTLLQRLLL
jgi:hypothetical protein